MHDFLGIENKNKIIENNFKIYKKFKNVICVSNHIKNKLIDYGFEGNINVIYPGIKNFSHIDDKINLRKILNLPLDKKLILSVSNNTPRKNLKFLNELFNNLGEEYKLVRVGQKVGDSITFNNVDDKTLNYIYNACDVMVYPSLEEGFGYPMAEAFYAGLPVVASNIDVFNEIGGGAAELCDININDFKEGIKNVLNDIDSYTKKSMDRSKIFDWDLYKSNVIKYFSILLNK